jgi:putative PIN family toxin of toxin-antitoxin system
VSAFFIIDTNVVVAGLLTAHADSPVARILDGILSARFSFVVSEALLAEYRTVLLRLKLCKLHGLTEPEVDIILTDIARHAIVLTPSNGSKVTSNAPDPGDQFLWELLNTRTDLGLVTGDKLLLADLAMQQRVILPQAFIAQLTH